MELTPFFKSVLEQDRAPVVLCDLEHTILYMNPTAVARYASRGGAKLIGGSLLDCHTEQTGRRIREILDWFAESPEHNMVYEFRNDEENKDVYTVALRGDDGTLIGYYEKHEYRNRETGRLYDLTD